MDNFIRRIGCLHKSIHGDGNDTLVRILNTCEQMLRDRGCTHVVRVDNILATIETGTSPVLKGRGGRNNVELFVHTEDKVGVKWARSILDKVDTTQQSTVVVVVSIDGPTPFTRKECEGKPLQFLLARDLCVNVTRHALVPRHEEVTEAPLGVAKESLPKIMQTDPIVQYHYWPVGTVVRITRRLGGHEPVPYFRVVSPN